MTPKAVVSVDLQNGGLAVAHDPPGTSLGQRFVVPDVSVLSKMLTMLSSCLSTINLFSRAISK
jgi:hypothetical protein